MVATVLSLKGYPAYQLNQLGPMLGLSEAAGRHKRASPGVRSLAVQQEARAHALLGDGDSCDRRLDTATGLADRAATRPDCEPPWVYFFSPDYLVMQRCGRSCKPRTRGSLLTSVDYYCNDTSVPFSYRRKG